jgi:fatty acid amide hydrolase
MALAWRASDVSAFTQRGLSPTENPLLLLSATELSECIARGDVAALEVTQAYLDRIAASEPMVHAFTCLFAEEALRQAAACDSQRAAGMTLGPLHGVPFTVKECFAAAGTPATLGLTHRAALHDSADGPHVARLKQAGGILLGKTNVSQLMLFHESDNPLFGRTNHPGNFERSPGGSSGGEAAAVAAHCSALGWGNDLGGSIRVPAAWCGVCGFKPTTHRLTNRGILRNFRGFQAMRSQSGPIARTVRDLRTAIAVCFDPHDDDVVPVAWNDTIAPTLPENLRVVVWNDDGYFPASPAARRAVEEAAQALADDGHEVIWGEPNLQDLVTCYYGLVMADGAADARLLAAGSTLDARVQRMFLLGNLPSWLRPIITAGYAWSGRTWTSRVLQEAHPRSVPEYWQLVDRLEQLTRAFHEQWFPSERPTLLLTPPHALPALRHGTSVDLLPAASYSFLANLVGIPAGVIPWGACQRTEEEWEHDLGGTEMNRLVRENLHDCASLPLGVQVMGPRWHDEWVLALMERLETLRR